MKEIQASRITAFSEILSQQLWEIDRSCFPPEIAYSAAEIRGYLRHRLGAHWLVRTNPSDEGSAIIGFILCFPARDKRGHVITVDVVPAHRGQGVGQVLLRVAEEHYAAAKFLGMRLEVAVNNANALRFYTRSGYRYARLLRGYYSRDLDGLQMEKDFGTPPRKKQ